MVLGQMNTRLRLQSETVTRSTQSGEATSSWTTETTLWASRRSPSGREFLESEQPRQERRMVWRMHYRDGVTPRHRLVEAASTGMVWDITSAYDPDGRKQWLQAEAVLRDE